VAARVIIVDYMSGNLHSIRRCLQRIKTEPVISADPSEIDGADKLILPGVGHFGQAIAALHFLNLFDALNKAVLVKQVPILGICLGMEVMGRTSEEGNAAGLGWFDASVVRFDIANKFKFKVPQIGWNSVTQKKESRLMRGVPDDSEFYFAHSYYLDLENRSEIVGQTVYERKYPSAVERENIFGVQYHPEKSYDVGTQVLKNFVEM